MYCSVIAIYFIPIMFYRNLDPLVRYVVTGIIYILLLPFLQTLICTKHTHMCKGTNQTWLYVNWIWSWYTPDVIGVYGLHQLHHQAPETLHT